MRAFQKLLLRVLNGESDQSIRFNDLCVLLVRLGFRERQQRGSHRIFYRDGLQEIVNLQSRNDGGAKPYQVRQVRGIIIKYQLGQVERSKNDS
ncbi:MAG: type II toxin-antitoxin system HicA family toxin [Gemmatimonadaceae bacterium]|nr:type II toxin-antitoxin system HicA family toxin [Gemmatimonadaceae bacterium]